MLATYTLIVVSALLPHTSQGGGNLAIAPIYGFATYQDCVNAGNAIRMPNDDPYVYETKVIFTCASTGGNTAKSAG